METLPEQALADCAQEMLGGTEDCRKHEWTHLAHAIWPERVLRGLSQGQIRPRNCPRT